MTTDRDAPTTQLAPFLHKFGIEEFRPGQREVIESVLAGEDSVCVMPTGGGKSLCYQLPAVVRSGICLVVSPLIALMKDQVDQLRAIGVAARLLNSSQTSSEQNRCLDEVQAGDIDLLYVAPERFRSPRFQNVMRNVSIQLLAVDEAHCISEWGHDFRHDYSRLGEHRARLGNPQTIALTATATEEVRSDIAAQLELANPQTFIAGFARKNLYYCVESVSTTAEKMTVLGEFLADHPGSGIIYSSSRRACEEVAAALVGSHMTDGRDVAVYHAGMPSERRKEVQEAFMSGRKPIVVATNAFGMGINKSDVRFVIHYQVPGSIESYYQEAGRAGRDGLPSTCLMLSSLADRYIQEFFIDNAHPSEATLAEVYEFLRQYESDPIEMTQQELQEALGLKITTEGIGTCERILEKAKVLERLEPNRNMAAVRIDSTLPTLVDLVPRQARVRRSVLAALEGLVGDRRGERVYVRPEEIAVRAQCEPAAAQRALREVSRLSEVDYVPPFRGRAIHLLKPDDDFRALNLDLSQHQERRKLNIQKLDRMFQFAKSRRCRQQQILAYFGEPGRESCGHCDNCSSSVRPTIQVQTDDSAHDETIRQATLMVLSGVARCRGRFGKSVVAAMLCGSRSKKVTRWKLEQLSTFGLFASVTQKDILEFIDELVRADVLEAMEINRHRPILQLTDQGIGVMRGDVDFDEPLCISKSLLSKLNVCVERATRNANGRAARQAVSESEPRTDAPRDDERLVDPTGGGTPLPDAPPNTTSADDTATDNTATDHALAPPLDTQQTRPAHDVPRDVRVDLGPSETQTPRPDFWWTWRLLGDGYSATQCALIRHCTEDQV